jgi:hypothetical protein
MVNLNVYQNPITAIIAMVKAGGIYAYQRPCEFIRDRRVLAVQTRRKEKNLHGQINAHTDSNYAELDCSTMG